MLPNSRSILASNMGLARSQAPEFLGTREMSWFLFSKINSSLNRKTMPFKKAFSSWSTGKVSGSVSGERSRDRSALTDHSFPSSRATLPLAPVISQSISHLLLLNSIASRQLKVLSRFIPSRLIASVSVFLAPPLPPRRFPVSPPFLDSSLPLPGPFSFTNAL